jgi:hypothetical protein
LRAQGHHRIAAAVWKQSAMRWCVRPVEGRRTYSRNRNRPTLVRVWCLRSADEGWGTFGGDCEFGIVGVTRSRRYYTVLTMRRWVLHGADDAYLGVAQCRRRVVGCYMVLTTRLWVLHGADDAYLGVAQCRRCVVGCYMVPTMRSERRLFAGAPRHGTCKGMRGRARSCEVLSSMLVGLVGRT